ncbi:MAG: primosomal protein N', partial [Dorea sp.]|nr:primosomal protein N' [Dorea sp.]
MYANIIIDITHEKVDKVFGYHIPSHMEGMLSVGSEVIVPFGMGNREQHGYVVGFTETMDYDPSKIKSIIRIAENRMAIESKLVALAAWMKEEYGGTMIQALKTVIPIKKKEKQKEKKVVRLLLSKEEAREKLSFYQARKNQKARARLLEALVDEPIQDYSLLVNKLHITASTLKSLEEQEILVVESEQVFRNPIRQERKERQAVTFSPDQRQAIESFWSDYQSGKRGAYLIHGVTGSGKTEVYMEMIARVIAEGKQAIVLIPEIALTYQTVMRFYSRFGDRISILNSRMSPGERFDQTERVRRGEVDVMIGPRSALFTPFEHLGLIVIDEEHETSYKSEQVPRYHARETALQRAKMEGASVVLGSATPSLEAYYACETGQMTLLRLERRIGERAMAEVYVEDMREEFKSGNRSILSTRLQQLMEDRLEKKEQIMLFLNRRGYAGFVSCRSCGNVVKCPHCDVSLSSHRGKKLVCHYCGYTQKAVETCPACGSPYIGGFKAGTQQIEDLVKKRFPEARVLRMDLDTTRSKEGHEKILEAFSSEEADILIGTQMIVKGHDFPNVTLVGILAADMSLHSDDYRAVERTFQL